MDDAGALYICVIVYLTIAFGVCYRFIYFNNPPFCRQTDDACALSIIRCNVPNRCSYIIQQYGLHGLIDMITWLVCSSWHDARCVCNKNYFLTKFSLNSSSFSLCAFCCRLQLNIITFYKFCSLSTAKFILSVCQQYLHCWRQYYNV